MKRRDFLRSAGMVSAAMAFPKVGRTFVQGTAPEAWRTFDVTTSVQVLKPSGTTRIWMPTALLNPTPFQKTLANDFKAEGGTAKLVEGGTDSLGIITAEFPSGVMPVLTVTSRVTTKNFAVDLSAPSKAPKEDPAELKHFLRADEVDSHRRHRESDSDRDHQGREHGRRKGARDLRMDRGEHNPRIRRRAVAALGDIRFMLETKDLAGKCADLNALYVGLARAAGLPARDVYGIRVAEVRAGIQELGRLRQRT